MNERNQLREALASAIASAEEARAPERVLGLLRAAFRTLDSARLIDDDMIRWAEAGLGAWRRWSVSQQGSQRIIVIDNRSGIAPALQQIVDELSLGGVRIAMSRNAALEALATYAPTAIVFDRDLTDLVPTVEMLEWLSTDLSHIRRIAFTQDDAGISMRERSLYHALLPKPPDRESFVAAVTPFQLRSTG
jgi:hypothetical protein